MFQGLLSLVSLVLLVKCIYGRVVDPLQPAPVLNNRKLDKRQLGNFDFGEFFGVDSVGGRPSTLQNGGTYRAVEQFSAEPIKGEVSNLLLNSLNR